MIIFGSQKSLTRTSMFWRKPKRGLLKSRIGMVTTFATRIPKARRYFTSHRS